MIIALACVLLIGAMYQIWNLQSTVNLLKNQAEFWEQEVQSLKKTVLNNQQHGKKLAISLSDLENTIADIKKQKPATAPRALANTYNQAAKMVECGCTISDLVTSLGLSHAEARLIVMMQNMEHD